MTEGYKFFFNHDKKTSSGKSVKTKKPKPLSVEGPYIPKDKDVNLKLPEKEIDFIQIRKDLLYISRTMHEQVYFDEKCTKLYYDNIIPQLSFATNIPDDLRSFLREVFDQMCELSKSDDNLTLREDKCILVKNIVDFKKPEAFYDSLKTLMHVEESYADFKSKDSTFYFPEDEELLQNLISHLDKKSQDKESNLLLSEYLNHLKKDPNYIRYAQISAYYLVDIGNNVFADVSSSTYDGSIELFQPEDYKKIKDFIPERIDLSKKIEVIQKEIWNKLKIDLSWGDFEYSPKGELLFVQAGDQEDEGLKISEDNLSIVKDYMNNEQRLEEIEGLLQGMQRKYVSNKDVFLNDKNDFGVNTNVFGMLWSHKTFRDSLEKKVGIELKDFKLPEQFQIIDFLKTLTNEKSESIKSFLSKYGKNGFRTFLSIEHGGKEMGDKILTLGEKLPEESTKVLFKTYGDMVDASEEVGSLLVENLGEKATAELVSQAKDSLLIGGKQLLERYADKAKVCVGPDCETLGQELKERLALAKASVFAFSYACKTLVERGEFSFEDFKKAKLSYDKSPIPEKMREEIIAMHKENTKQYPEGLRDYWRGTLREGLEKENPKQMVVSVEYEGNVTTAMRVIEQEDGSWYGASFNVNPTVMGSRIGSELLKKVIEDLAKDKPFVADCYAENPMLEIYTKKFGFEITDTNENYKDTGAKVYQITLRPKLSYSSPK